MFTRQWQKFNLSLQLCWFPHYTNIRAIQDETYMQFSDWLLRIGRVDELQDDYHQVTLPQKIVTKSLQDMINFVYPPTQPGNHHVMPDPFYMRQNCCLIPLSENSRHINDLILQQLDTLVHTYLSTELLQTIQLKQLHIQWSFSMHRPPVDYQSINWNSRHILFISFPFTYIFQHLYYCQCYFASTTSFPSMSFNVVAQMMVCI